MPCTAREKALAFWRGRPHTAVADEPGVAATVARLEELRGQLRERLVEAPASVADAGPAEVHLPHRLPAPVGRADQLATNAPVALELLATLVALRGEVSESVRFPT